MSSNWKRRILPLALIASVFLIGGYIAGSYLGVADVSDLLTGLSLEEAIAVKSELAEIKNAEIKIAEQGKEIEANRIKGEQAAAALLELKESEAAAKEIEQREDELKAIDAALQKQTDEMEKDLSSNEELLAAFLKLNVTDPLTEQAKQNELLQAAEELKKDAYLDQQTISKEQEKLDHEANESVEDKLMDALAVLLRSL